MENKKLDLAVEVNKVFNYAVYQNGGTIVKGLKMKNLSGKELTDLTVKITTDIDLIEPFEQYVQVVRATEELVINSIKLVINGQYLAQLTERVLGNLHIEVFKGEELLAEEYSEIIALAYDEWPGLSYYPELLAAFVTPNHPEIAEIVHSASKYLEKWTKRPSLDGYQSKDPNRVKLMAAAVYAAVQERNITYAVPPSSFEEVGQRVRLVDAVLSQQLGTCLDLTLLYVACLEAIGLNPFMVLTRGHIFAGVWLVDSSFSDSIIDDPTQVEKRMAEGINEVTVVECTMVCSGNQATFEDAVKSGKNSVANHASFEMVIDLMRVRRGGVRPLPLRVVGENGFEIRCDEQPVVTTAPEEVGETYEYKEENEQPTKETQWERKLLDFSMRNTLLNMRLTKTIVPILSASVEGLEDALADGEEFRILPRPIEWEHAGEKKYTIETVNELGQYKELITAETKHKKLHTIYTEKELNAALVKLYRTAKTSIEENGASTLFLATGLLRWYEKKGGNTPRYAPLVLIPVEMTRKSANKGYALRMRDEEAQVNITLLEFLKQNYGIKINGLNPLPTDEHGLDMKKIFAAVRHGIMEEKMWDVVEAGFLGNFAFAQFVMWNDIHNGKEMLHNSKLVLSLMDGVLKWDTEVPEDAESDEAYLPVTVDASQLRAVNMAANGESFVLHGPPGTGKSQTITAMIANALAKGKKVLFVAEKKAALEVVQKRLASLGIEDFCLELHSNKTVKKEVLEQLKRALEIKGIEWDSRYEEKTERMKKMRRELDGYPQKLHEKKALGMSLREVIDLYETIPEHGKELRFPVSYARELTQEDLENHVHLLERLVAAGKAVGHPHGHPYAAIRQTVYTQSLKAELQEAAERYKEALEAYEEAGGNSEDGAKTEENIREYLLTSARLQQDKKELLAKWDEKVLCMDVNIFKDKYEEAGRKVFGKGKALAALTAELQMYARFPVAAERIPEYLKEIASFQKKAEEFGKSSRASSGFITVYSEMRSAESAMKELLDIDFDKKDKGWISVRKQLCDDISDGTVYIKDWIVYRKFEKECKDAGLERVCEAYEKGLDHDEVMDVYLRSVYKAVILSAIEEEEALNGFTGIGFNECIHQFRKMDEEFMELTKQEMYCKLAQGLPDGSTSPEISKELNILRRAIASNGRGLSIRALFDQIPNILKMLCPCMLMSPISVAQYLPAENDQFDIVIFDEASQLPTCKAVGVLARGKSAVVVGDPKQMPPTTFFTGNSIDEENLDMEDLDSILDDCLALGLPEAHLRWHYRSRHESLIAFSNSEFYENSMMTFPSVNDQERRVRFQKVDGHFDRKKGRVNEAEAKAIVAEIRRRYQEEGCKGDTIGVVTFNVSQQTLIEDLLQVEYQKDAEFDKWANAGDEPVFVKNLENVQGDERDVILFSIAFGPDADGKVSLNFGPINKENGWKRLNVAVTRARSEMVVFSTMTSDMIDLKRTRSKGVESMKNFLEYAETGRTIGRFLAMEHMKKQGIIDRICAELEKEGYECSRNIGHSDFKIDIAVKNPEKSEEYLLGIMLDGDSYKKSKNTKDREIAQKNVLHGLGWKLHRIWTMDWWDSRERELARLMKVLEEQKEKAA